MEQIESGVFKYENRPVYVKWPKGSEDGKWHIWGPEDKMPIGGVAEVYQFGSDDYIPVEILEYVAERMVAKRDGSRTRFVLATFDKVVTDEFES